MVGIVEIGISWWRRRRARRGGSGMIQLDSLRGRSMSRSVVVMVFTTRLGKASIDGDE
jgi:hypothetical protein